MMEEKKLTEFIKEQYSKVMEKYILVTWPESQKWEGKEGVIVAWDEDDTYVFVPEELYNK